MRQMLSIMSLGSEVFLPRDGHYGKFSCSAVRYSCLHCTRPQMERAVEDAKVAVVQEARQALMYVCVWEVGG